MQRNEDRERSMNMLVSEVLSVNDKISNNILELDIDEIIMNNAELSVLRQENDALYKQIDKLQYQLNKANKHIKELELKYYNNRNSGRKKLADTQRFKDFAELIEQGITDRNKIMNILKISQRTYYNYRKEYYLQKSL